MRFAIYLILAVLLLAASSARAGSPTENQWARSNANRYRAEVEVVQWEQSRIDYVTNDYVIEIDWAKKWHEGIGQSLYYAILLPEKKPALILLVKDWKTDRRFCLRAQSVCAKYGIRLFIERVPQNGSR